MDVEYAIELAKTEYRDAFNTGNIDRLLNLLSEGFVDMSEGHASLFGPDAREELRENVTKLLAKFQLELQVVIIGVRSFGDWAFDYGWHKLLLTPKSGGEPVIQRKRYLEIWQKIGDQWKIAIYMDSKEAEVLARQTVVETASSVA